MGLVIALNKGRILKESLPILASCGVEPVEHPSESRKPFSIVVVASIG